MTPNQAYRKVHSAIKRGALNRPCRCENCGRVPMPTSDVRAAIQAHHHNYSLPLDVQWVCAKCHRAVTPLPAIMGGKAIGSVNGQAKLTESLVVEAKSLRAERWTFKSIASRFGVHKSTAIRAINGNLWKHTAAPPKQEKP